MTKQFDSETMTITTQEFLALVGNVDALHGTKANPEFAVQTIAGSLIDDVLALVELQEMSAAPDVLEAIQRRVWQARAAIQIWTQHRYGEVRVNELTGDVEP
jgi:hypothetical protein